jgi:hypothetical protein
MAFVVGDLSMSDGARSPRFWKYTTNDLMSTVVASGYFNASAAGFNKGDLIFVSGDLDGTIFTTQVTVSSADAAATVTTTNLATATLTFSQNVPLTTNLLAVGTASTTYMVSPVAGMVTYVSGVLDVSGLGSGGTSTITVSVPTTGAIATLPFLQDTAAGAAITDSTITAHTALTAGGVITLATDGTGSHTGAARVTIMITPT